MIRCGVITTSLGRVGVLLAATFLAGAQAPGVPQAARLYFVPPPPRLEGPPGQLVLELKALSTDQFAAVAKSASAGDAASQALLCVAYRIGRPVARDPAQARTWCGKAAAQGNVAAMEETALIDIRGDGDAPDRAAGLQWMRKAAEAGSPSAMDNLGALYFNAVGVPKDLPQAFAWYERSAAAGFAPGQLDLGLDYLQGTGVKADRKKGIAWMEKAAQGGLPRADFLLGQLSLAGGAGIRRDAAAAVKYFEAGANLGNSQCANSLGWMFANGAGVSRNEALAVKWYGMAADHGDPVGEYGLGIRYLRGQGVERDPARALQLFQRAAAGGHADAAYNAALILINIIPGHTGPPDYTGAIKNLTIAAEQGITDGQCLLGQMYAKGLGTDADPVKADKWFALSHHGTLECDPDRREIEKTMSPDQLAAAQRQIAAFVPKSIGINYGADGSRH